MAEKKIIVGHGEKLSVEIPKESTPDLVSPEAARRAALFPSDVDEELYAFRQGITFYDLGTRKQEDGSYAHITFNSFTQAHLSNIWPPLVSAYNAALLAGDFTHNQACAKLQKKSQFLYFDVVFKKTGEDDDGELIGEKDTRPYVQDLPLQGSPMPASVHESKWTGSLKFSKSGWQMRVESAWFYNEFDTSDLTRFKITESADPDASPFLDFKVSGGMRIFLTPRCNFFGFDAGALTTYHLSRFLPVLPLSQFETQPPFTQIGFVTTGGVQMRAHATVDFWTAIASYYLASYPSFDSGSAFIDDDASAYLLVDGHSLKALVAVVVQGSKTYYVWRTGIFDSNLWHANRVYNPSF
jgi:hypothetical protein